MPSQKTVLLGDGTTRKINNTQFFKILMGGDQLTVAHVKGRVVDLHTTHDSHLEHLSGIVPVIEAGMYDSLS